MARAVDSSSLRPITVPAACLALLCAALWGGTAVAIQFTQDAWPPLGTAGLRFALGTLFLAGWCKVEGQRLAIRPGQLGPILAVGMMLFVQIATFHVGLNRTDSAHGSVMIGTNPLWVALLAHFVLQGDRLTPMKVVGLLTATGGIVAVVSGGQAATSATAVKQASLLGDAIILFSSWLLGYKTVFTKKSLATVEPGKLIFWSNLVGTIMLLTAGLIFEGVGGYHYSHASLLGLLYQGLIVAGFCFAAWTALLRRHPASQLAVFGFAQPLFGILFSVLLRDDPLTLTLVLGGMAVASGIFIVTRENALRRRRNHAE